MRKSILTLATLGLFYTGFSQTFFNQQALKGVAPSRQTEDYFGFVSRISGDYIIVGAGYEDEDVSEGSTLAESGSAYIFERSSGGWSYAQKLVASDRSTDDYFGYGASISGSTAIVGASYHELDEDGANLTAGAGAVYVYEREAEGSWKETQKLVASDRSEYDEFGISVDISGDYAIIGAYGTNNYAGAAYIFERDGDGDWIEVDKLEASDATENDAFGEFVAISGDYAIVAAYADESYTGAAYIFERDGDGNWTEKQKLVASDGSTDDTFGGSVDISGDYAIVGAYAEDEDESGSNTKSDAGSAYVFERDVDGDWSEVQKLVASDRSNQDQFGISVTVSGDYAVVGAHQEDEWSDGTDTQGNAGSAYVYKRSSAGVWSEKEKLVTYDREAQDKFGTSVALDEGFLVVGAQGESFGTDADAGAIYIFEGLITWKGNSGTDWANANNWEDKVLPTASYNVSIPDVTNQPFISEAHSINNIELESNATLTVGTEGSLILMGTASGDGQVIVQKNVLGGDGSANSGGYNIISSPFSDATVASLDGPNLVYAFDGANYQNMTSSTSASLNPAQGYFVAYDQIDPVMEIEGMLNSGDVSIGLTYSDDSDDENDYNLVGNPYAASISHSEWVANNGPAGLGAVDGSVYFWDDGGSNLGDGTRDGIYQAFDADGDASTGTTASFDGYIRSGQGFYVRALASADIQFTPAMQVKVTDSNDDAGFFRTQPKQLLRVALSNGQSTDETLIKFREGATAGQELGYDVNKLMNPSISLYSMMEGNELAIQSLPVYADQTFEIDLGFSVAEPGQFSLSLTDVEGISNQSVHFRDNLTNEVYSLNQHTAIEIDINELASTNRFTLILGLKELLHAKPQLDGISVIGNPAGLTLNYPGASDSECVIIYDLEGRVIYEDVLSFDQGSASLQANLKTKKIYVIKAGSESAKFILK